jgi:putative oxygen-independent coproporphyrinogen III oxidase
MMNIPLSLYIHLPWCIRKCPYCDFNSHALRGELPEKAYVTALLQDLQQDLPRVAGRTIHSIFIGGGTPSLFSPNAIESLLTGINKYLPISANTEITLEANPGTVEQSAFAGFRQAGINRLSIGIQSFQDEKLKTLGRIHGSKEALRAVQSAQQAGFTNFNLDLMFGLPQQTIADALFDLTTAIDLQPTHISWYQLTLEPNTFFYQHPPTLPNDDHIWEMQTEGQALLATHTFNQYEISAYSKAKHQCQHNLNYWEFGDYLGIGAGAHGKITDLKNGTVHRMHKLKHPKIYLDSKQFIAEEKNIATKELAFEFMLNALRLKQTITLDLFSARTGLHLAAIEKQLAIAASNNLLQYDQHSIKVTEHGYRFLNNLLEIFLPIG